MNGIGVIEWRDGSSISTYPLESDPTLKSVLVDADFVQFDNFIPILKSVTVQNTGIDLTITFDDGDFNLVISNSNCVDGYTAIIRSDTRYYGKLVLGIGISSFFSNNQGNFLALNTPFSSATVRSIPTSSGVFSIQGLSGNVDISTDESQWFDQSGNTLTWNTVSKPSRVDQHLLKGTMLYTLTNRNNVVEINPADGTTNVLFTLDQDYNTIATINGKLVATDNVALYDITSYPPVKLCDTPQIIKAMTVNKVTGNLVGISANSIIYFASDLSSVQATYLVNLSLGKAIVSTAQDTFLVATPGPYDTANSSYVSDIIYSITISGTATSVLGGMLSVNGDYHQPTTYGFVELDSVIYALVSNTSSNRLLQLDTTVYTGTLLYNIANDISTGQFDSLVPGNNILITLNNITPLKTINSTSPINNAIQILGGGLIQIEQTNADELTVSLGVDVDLTKIQRTVKYGT